LKQSDAIGALTGLLPKELAKDLVTEFVTMRQDTAQGTLGRAAPGKFVETFVQALEYIEGGSYSKRPSVDKTLTSVESKTALDDGLRISGARLARAMYSLRSKRNIVHKGMIDPNTYDLQLLFSGAQWILSELIRLASGITKEDAGKLVKQIQAPIGDLVEDFGHKKLVLADLSARKEILVLLQLEYPDSVPLKVLINSMDRRSPSTVRSALKVLWEERRAEKAADNGYVITSTGLKEATEIVASIAP